MTGLDQTLDKQQEYFSLAAICDQCCNDMDLSISHYFQKFLSWATWGLVQLKMDTANCVKPVILDVSDVLTCDLPSDCVDVVRVALIWGQYVKELGKMDELALTPRTTANFNPSKSNPPGWLPNGTDATAYGMMQFANYGGRALISVPGSIPHRGHYAIKQCDNGCKQIYLDAGICDNNQIYVEYIGLGINSCNEDTIVGPMLAEYVRCYIHHQYAKFGKRSDRSEAEIQRTGRDLYHAEMNARARTNAISKTDLQTIARANYRLTAHI